MQVELPVSSQTRRTALWKRWLVRLFRLLVVLVAAVIIYQANLSNQRRQIGPAVSLEQAQLIYPQAFRLGLQDPQTHSHLVYDAAGSVLGKVLRTSPEMDSLIGYRGPSDVLIGLNQTIDGVILLSSRETESHVEQIVASNFFEQFRGHTALDLSHQSIDSVSGSTLTAMTIVEAVRSRLGGSHQSLRFPEPISLSETLEHFPNAHQLQEIHHAPGWFTVLDENKIPLGEVTRTSPLTDQRIGYQGPTDLLIALAADGNRIVGLSVRKSYETPEYYERIVDSETYLNELMQLTVEDWKQLDLIRSGIEGVSGATITSYVLAANLQQQLNSRPAEEHWGSLLQNDPKQRHLILFSLLLIATLLWTFVPFRSKSKYRFVWQLGMVTCYLWGIADLLSISMFSGWAQEFSIPALFSAITLLLAVAILTPWISRKQIYCHQMCPHGIAQEWISRKKWWRISIPTRWAKRLSLLPGFLLMLAAFLVVLQPSFDLSLLEPFDAWSVGVNAQISFALLVVSLLITLATPQAYCRYGCPTGALLKFVRSHGSNDHWGRKEWIACGFLILLGCTYGWQNQDEFAPQIVSSQNPVPQTVNLKGTGYQTEWSLELPSDFPGTGQLQQEISQLIDEHEATFSATRKSSLTSRFNSSKTTLEMEFDPQFIELLIQVQKSDEWRMQVLRPGETEDQWIDAGELTIYPEYHSVEKGEPSWQLDWEPFLKSDAKQKVQQFLKSKDLENAVFRW